ncbi:MAG: hypothetical protein ACOX8I_08755, partial [Bacillota bacterium]
ISIFSQPRAYSLEVRQAKSSFPESFSRSFSRSSRKKQACAKYLPTTAQYIEEKYRSKEGCTDEESD